ncbi:MAG: spore coat associated protein CotJA [Oscillospiraceae bacterium]|jgi:hypothetical protein|nr:spore coat associated protein CotJA [Oscillospiraceae bacterium]
MDMTPMPGIPFPGMYTRPRHENRQPLAMVYITPQLQITNTFAPLEALRAGTLFPELKKPFLGRRGEV